MTGKQITGVILLLIGLGVSFIGVSNVIDLINVGNNELVRLGLQLHGTSLTSLWIKYGLMSFVGITMVIIGINFAKKQVVEVKNPNN